MTTRDLDHFMANPGEFDRLTEDQRATLYETGSIEGDTPDPDKATAADDTAATVKPEGSEGSSASPDAASTADDTKTTEGTDPVILAKDGVHTIPFEELQAARDRATQLERENAELLAKMKPAEQPAAQKPADTEAAAPAAPAQIDLDALEGEYQDALLEGDKPKATEIRRQINAEIKRQSEESAVQRLKSEREAEQAEATAKTAQEQFSEVVQKAIKDFPFLDAKAAEANQQAITDVKVWRDHLIGQGKTPAEALAAAVERFGPMYAGTPQSKPQPTPGESAAEKAAKAIASAKSGIPASLSDIPAGTPNPHDEAAAMLNMGGNALITKFAGKTPEQIEALMAKVI